MIICTPIRHTQYATHKRQWNVVPEHFPRINVLVTIYALDLLARQRQITVMYAVYVFGQFVIDQYLVNNETKTFSRLICFPFPIPLNSLYPFTSMNEHD